MPFTLEIATNKVNADKNITEIQGQRAYLYKPGTAVTAKNWKILQFFDLMDKIKNYSYVGEENVTTTILKRYVQGEGIDLENLKAYLLFYSEDIIKKIYAIFCKFTLT